MKVIMKKWAYRSEIIKDDNYLIAKLDGTKYTENWKPLNELGEEGWEIIAIVDAHDSNETYMRAYMKKEVGRYAIQSGAKLNLKTDIKISPDNYLK